MNVETSAYLSFFHCLCVPSLVLALQVLQVIFDILASHHAMVQWHRLRIAQHQHDLHALHQERQRLQERLLASPGSGPSTPSAAAKPPGSPSAAGTSAAAASAGIPSAGAASPSGRSGAPGASGVSGAAAGPFHQAGNSVGAASSSASSANHEALGGQGGGAKASVANGVGRPAIDRGGSGGEDVAGTSGSPLVDGQVWCKWMTQHGSLQSLDVMATCNSHKHRNTLVLTAAGGDNHEGFGVRQANTGVPAWAPLEMSLGL